MTGIDGEQLDGTWFVLASTQATVVLDAAEADDLRDEVQRAIEGPDPTVAFLSALTSRGVRDLPRFAYVGREGASARILLRGALEAVERRPDGAAVRHAAGSLSTWAEVVATGCSDIAVCMPSGRPVAVTTFSAPPERVEAAADPTVAGALEAATGGVSPDASTERPEASAAISVGDQVGADLGGEGSGSAAGPAPAIDLPRADETVLPGPDFELALPGDGAPASAEPAQVVPVVATDEDEVDLSHLFETRHVGVEAAAVRAAEVDTPPADDGAAPGAQPGSTGVEALAVAPSVDGGSSSLHAAPPGLADLPPPTGPPIGQPSALPAGAPSGLPHSLPPPTGPPAAAPPPPGLISGVPGAGPAGPAPASAPVPDAGDHDGLTISPAQLAALRGGTNVAAADSRAARTGGPQLQAVACPSGHLNPPQAERCRSCAAPIADRTIRLVARPTLGHLRFDSGMVADIDRPMLIGRKPTVDGLAPGVEVPSLVVLPDPDGSLSRVHAEVRIEGWEVLVVDRDSTNGTRVEIPGQPPVLLRPHDPILITSGTKITFADVVTATFNTGPR